MDRSRQWFMVLIMLLVVAGSGFATGVVAERGGLVPGAVRFGPAHVEQQFSPFWEAWELAENHFVDRSAVNPQDMTYGAIEGMLAALGDVGHTRFLTPEDAEAQRSTIAGHFQGIGAELGQKDGNPVIVAPLDGSPAEKAGLRPGDILVAVDGQSVAGMSLDQVVRMVRGPEGTDVKLTIIREGQGSRIEVVITRARIQLDPVSWAMVPGTEIAHLRLSQFSANATQGLVDALSEIRAAGATALVLDVRSNPGGLLDQAVAVTSQFVSEGDVLLEQDAEGNRTAFPALMGARAADLPLVVLVNQGTASGAEILAGAIQDQGRGKVVGETTFGTGTVLSSFYLSDGSALLLGTSQWLTPSGRQIWKQGIEPDEEVLLSLDATPITPRRQKEMTAEELLSSDDAQLLRALELLGVALVESRPMASAPR